MYDWGIILGIIFSIRENREKDHNEKGRKCEEKRKTEIISWFREIMIWILIRVVKEGRIYETRMTNYGKDRYG